MPILIIHYIKPRSLKVTGARITWDRRLTFRTRQNIRLARRQYHASRWRGRGGAVGGVVAVGSEVLKFLVEELVLLEAAAEAALTEVELGLCEATLVRGARKVEGFVPR